ncbi:MAG: YdeI/OmpD-associated family protein [Bacteroidota bacterium]
MGQETYKNVQAIVAEDSTAWRQWLEDNHSQETAVWLIIFRKESDHASVYYPQAVDDALCYGWIDSKPNKRDDHSYYQYFSARNPKSNWSKVNKDKVERLIAEGLMRPAGFKIIEIAKQNGTWDTLNDVDNLIVPPDLSKLFEANPKAFNYWKDFPDSTKRGILEWIFNAKRPETRQKRIIETVELAEKNVRANQFIRKT